MAYDEGLAHRVEEMIGETPGLTSKKMFGGLGFIVFGNMATGVTGDRLIVRVGPDEYEAALQEKHTEKFGPTGRTMIGWVSVGPEILTEDMDLRRWVQLGLKFCTSLPPK